MKRKKWVAIITGAISVAIAVAYLILVQFLDFRGEMLPAPVSVISLFSELSQNNYRLFAGFCSLN